MWLAHNPGMSDLAFVLTGKESHGMATGSIHRIALPLESWADVKKYCAESQWHIWPKMFKDQ